MESLMLTSLNELEERKKQGLPLTMLTAYDYPTARLLDEAGVDLLLVGDSLGMVVLGLPDTVGVTMNDMLHHAKAVRRGVQRAPVVVDLPYHSYLMPGQALHNARRLQRAGADAVKLEGGEEMAEQVWAITHEGIPFVGHIGMLPQSVREEGGYKKKGRTDEGAEQLRRDARALEEVGACAVILESVMPEVAAMISQDLKIPTIGIGSGQQTDGQVLVTPDLLGSFPWFRPPFATVEADLAGETRRAVQAFIERVQKTSFCR
jgi:3-methyl-2-oxobutanoate hydroxymethyltransferase